MEETSQASTQLEKSFGDTFEMIASKFEKLFILFHFSIVLTTHLLD
jgi:hypothetical protein